MIDTINLNEARMQLLFWLNRRNSFATVVPNCTPKNWYECDLFCVTRAGYFNEFEIKLSKSDFRADQKKGVSETRSKYGMTFTRESKHERLANGDVGGPSRFWYLVPTGLISVADIPDYAGLIYYDADQDKMIIEKHAPKIHKDKIDTETETRVLRNYAHRFWMQKYEDEYYKSGVYK